MIFKAKDLNFLELYSVCVDQKSIIGKNFQIERIDDNIIRFSQVTDNVVLFTDLDIKTENNFSYNYPTSSIVQFLKTCQEDEKIELLDNGLKLNKAEYNFESIEYNSSSMKDTFNTIKTNFINNSKVKIVDLEKINNIKNYVGVEKGLDVVALINNYFVASNRYDATACIKTINKSDNFFLSKMCSQLISSFKIKEANFLLEEDKSIFKIGDTFVIIPKQEYIIPDIFTEEFKSYYNFSTKTIVKKVDLLFALNRINIISRENINSRIFFTFKENKIIIESKDKGYAVEEVDAIVDKELVDHYVILSSNYLINATSLINTENLIIKVLPDKNSNVISVFPQGHEDMFVIQNILEYID